MTSFAALASEIDDDPKQPVAPSSFADLADEVGKDQETPSSTFKEPDSYFARVGNALDKFQNATASPTLLGGAGKTAAGIGETVLNAATGLPQTLLKHGIAEGAYLRGESPSTAKALSDQIIDRTYQPRTESGKTLTELLGTALEPIPKAIKSAAESFGASDPMQDLAVDLAPAAIPITKNIRQGASDANAYFQKLVAAGKASPNAATAEAIAEPVLSPQQLRGQEAIPEPVKQAIRQQPEESIFNGAEPARVPRQAGYTIDESDIVRPQAAPPITVENASPELQAIIKKTGDKQNATMLQRQLEADSLPVKVGLTEGQAMGDIHKISDEWNTRGKQPALADRFNAQNSELIDNVNAIRDRIAPKVTDDNHVDNGANLIGNYRALQAAREAEVSANYKALADANNGAIPVDGKAFAANVNQALGKGLVNQREFLPSTVENIVNRIANSDQQMTFDDFTTLRTILAKEARKAARAGDGNASHAISLVRNQLEEIPMGPGAEALKPLADAAKNSARDLFRDSEADPAWNAVNTDKIAPDDFVKKYVINAKRDDLARLQQNIGGDPIARQTIAAGAMNYLKKQAGISGEAEGNFSASGYNKALDALRPKLEFLLDPVSAQQVDTLGKVARYTLEQKRGSFVNNSNTAVSLMRDAALSGAEGALNIKTGGAYGAAKGMIQASKAGKAAERAVQPGVGIPLKDLK